MNQRIPRRHLVVIASAAAAIVEMQRRGVAPAGSAAPRIRIRIPITIRPRKTGAPLISEQEGGIQ